MRASNKDGEISDGAFQVFIVDMILTLAVGVDDAGCIIRVVLHRHTFYGRIVSACKNNYPVFSRAIAAEAGGCSNLGFAQNQYIAHAEMNSA